MKSPRVQARASSQERQLLYAALVLGSLLVVVTCGSRGSHAPALVSSPAAASAALPEPAASVAHSAAVQPEVQGPDAGPDAMGAAQLEAGAARPQTPLARFRGALDALRRGERSSAVRILWLGDSHTAADFWTDTVRQQLWDESPVGGPGFVYLGLDHYRHSRVAIDVKGDWQRSPSAPSTSSKTDDGVFGLGGIRTSPVSADASVKLTPRSGSLVGDARWTVWFRMPDGRSSFRVALGSQARVVRGKRVGHVETLKLNGGSAQSLEIRAQAGRPQLMGATIESSEPGVVLDTVGINGARVATALAWDAEAFVRVVRERAPELLIMAFGTNEAGANTPVERYRSHFSALLDRVRRATPDVSCALLGPTDWARHEARVVAIDRLERVVAGELGCAYFSVYDAMGGSQSSLRWSQQRPALAAPDLIHLTPKGYAAVGADTARFLLGER